MLHTIRYRKIIVPKSPPGGGGSRVYSQLKVYSTGSWFSVGHESRLCTNIFSITTVTAIKRGDNKPSYYSSLATLYVNVIIIIMLQVQCLDPDVCQNCKMTRSLSLTALLPLLFSRCFTALHVSNPVKMHWCLPDGSTIRGSHLTWIQCSLDDFTLILNVLESIK